MAKVDVKEEDVVVEKKAKKSDVSTVVFTRKNGTTREFSADSHGEDFLKVADEFAETNALFIQSREDK